MNPIVSQIVWPGLAECVRDPSFAYQPFRSGVDIHPLTVDDEGRATSAILRYAPGARVPRHRHPGHEHIFVLHGEQVDDRGRYPAGTLVVNPPGSAHAVTCPNGAIVLVVWEKPVEFDSDILS